MVRKIVRRYLILARGKFLDDAKTAHGVIAYGQDEISAIVDASLAGKTVRGVLPHLQCDAPICESVREGLQYHPTSLLIGVAPQGGALPQAWRSEILHAMDAKLEIVSGLHELISEDEEFAKAARRSGTEIWDVRVPPTVPLFSGAVYDVRVPTLLTVGSDCAVGKMTVALELARSAQKRGVNATFVPTGQTGVLIAGWGICIDRVVSDFAAGAAEQMVLEAAPESELLIVEGQGSIHHPAYGAVTLALMYGCAPDALVLVVDPTARTIANFEVPALGYPELVTAYEIALAPVKPARVVGIALKTLGLDARQARYEIERAREESQLPCDDVVRFGADALYDSIASEVRRTRPRTAAVPA